MNRVGKTRNFSGCPAKYMNMFNFTKIKHTHIYKKISSR